MKSKLSELEIQWPKNLIEELAYNRGIVFTGAGLSATASNNSGSRMPGWNQTIEEAKALIPSTSTEILEYIESSLRNKDYLGALQCIQDYSDSGSYSALMRETFMRGSFTASKAHEFIMKLNLKVIVTTNFDTIYEDYCKSKTIGEEDLTYSVSQYYQEKSLLDNIKSFPNIIIKAHGSIDEIDKMVFTRNQFFKARNEYPNFYKLLEALFLTHNVLFIGYSFNDPDIQLLLNSEINNLTSGSPHYILVEENEVHKEVEKMWKENYNISTIKYPSSTEVPYKNFIPALESLHMEVESLRRERGILVV